MIKGDVVYFIEGRCNRVVRALIQEIFSKEECKYTKLRCLDEVGTTIRPVNQLYSSEEAAEASRKRIFETDVKNYLSKIDSVESLFRFMLDHDVSCCEYRDYAARCAAVEAGKSILGIVL